MYKFKFLLLVVFLLSPFYILNGKNASNNCAVTPSPFLVTKFHPQTVKKTDRLDSARMLREVKIDSRGNVYIPDYENNIIRKYDANGIPINCVGKKGDRLGEFQFQSVVGNCFYIDSMDNLYVFNSYPHYRLQVFDADGNFIKHFKFNQKIIPYSMVVDKIGRVMFSLACANKSFNTILTLTPVGDSYKILGKFAPQPFKNINLTVINELPHRSINTWQGNTLSTLIINNNDEIFQVFTYYPIIRKYSNTFNLIWTKEYTCLTEIPIFNSVFIARYGKLQDISNLSVREITKPSRTGYDIPGFGWAGSSNNKNKSFYIQIFNTSSILEINYDGIITNLYCPKDLFETQVDNSNQRYIKSKHVPSSFRFVYDEIHNFGIISLAGTNLLKVELLGVNRP